MKSTVAALPFILGLSLLGAGGAYLYMVLKKRRPSSGDDTVDFVGKTVAKQQEPCAVELVISNKLIPLVVGRKGYTLKHIQQSTGTSINFSERDESSQLCRIVGPSQAAVQKAQEMVLKETARPITVTEAFVVPQAACGKLLGRCGDELQEICRKSMAKVWLEGRARNESDRRVMITGTQAQIEVAKDLISQKVKEDIEYRNTHPEASRQAREPRIRTPPSSSAPTPPPSMTVRESAPSPKPAGEKLAIQAYGSGQMEVYVSAIVSPSKFFVQLVGPQSAELDALVDNMTEYYNQSQNRALHTLRKFHLGQIVAAEFNADNKWYRAEVCAVLPNEYKPGEVVLDLYFVDYGDNQYTNPNEVYELRPDFLALRFQAIECFLARVEPFHIQPVPAASAEAADDEWDPVAVSRFEELTHVAQWKKIISKIVTYRNGKSALPGRETSPIPGVELFDMAPNGVDQINIAQELVKEGLARKLANVSSEELTRSQLFRLGLTNGTSDTASSSQSSSIDRCDDGSASSSASASTVISNGMQQINMKPNSGVTQDKQSIQFRSLANGTY
ncbi:AGAP010171-PA-like protein [Anopheles sinensis]|uniref:AGAP010171-PA-like protein n=1 Tax=Anopheles sinensis TaxID=74873 RepID=A0A084VQ04_ANOSI|nr:AGAP010171-PA-like protein [Anopheles sinensis]